MLLTWAHPDSSRVKCLLKSLALSHLPRRERDERQVSHLALAFFFGLLVLFYASAWGAMVLVVLAATLVIPTMEVSLISVWPASIVWVAIAASKHHAFMLGREFTRS